MYQYNLKLTDEEQSVLDQLAIRYGGKKAAILAGLVSLMNEAKTMTENDIIAWVREMASQNTGRIAPPLK